MRERYDSDYFSTYENATVAANFITKQFREYNTAVRDSIGWYITNRFDPSCRDKSKGKKSNSIKPVSQPKEQDDG